MRDARGGGTARRGEGAVRGVDELAVAHDLAPYAVRMEWVKQAALAVLVVEPAPRRRGVPREATSRRAQRAGAAAVASVATWSAPPRAPPVGLRCWLASGATAAAAAAAAPSSSSLRQERRRTPPPQRSLFSSSSPGSARSRTATDREAAEGLAVHPSDWVVLTISCRSTSSQEAGRSLPATLSAHRPWRGLLHAGCSCLDRSAG